MSFGEGNLRVRVEELERERDYWKRECADMLSEFWDTESGHCAMLDYPRPASEPAPSIIVMASRMGNDEYRERAEKRISELENAYSILQSNSDKTRERWMKRGEYIAKQRDRISELESLVLDIFAGDIRCTGRSCGDCEHEEDEGCGLVTRAVALGLMEGGGDAETD